MEHIEPPLFYVTAYRQLQPVERHFVDAYVRTLDDDAARAGERISHALHRPITPEAIKASKGLLDRPNVQAAIYERVKELAEKQELTPRKVMRTVGNLAHSNIADYGDIGEDGNFTLNLSKASHDQLEAIQQIDIEEQIGKGGCYTRKTKIRLHAKLPAVELEMKYMGMLDPDNPYYRAETAKPANAHLPPNATREVAADLYQMLAHG